jgi:hypothetical protein
MESANYSPFAGRREVGSVGEAVPTSLKQGRPAAAYTDLLRRLLVPDMALLIMEKKPCGDGLPAGFRLSISSPLPFSENKWVPHISSLRCGSARSIIHRITDLRKVAFTWRQQAL